MDEDDILGRLEAGAGGDDAAGPDATAPVPVAGPEAVPFVGGGTAMDNALGCLPPEVALRVATVAARYGIRENNDPFWGAIEVMQNSFECAKASGASAAAAGASAEELARLLKSLPQQMLAGAKLASADVGGEIRSAVDDVRTIVLGTGRLVAQSMTKDVEHIKRVISDSSTLGADKIKNATDGLIGKLDEAVEKKKAEGVQAWANLAAEAGVIAARSAMGRVALRGGLFTALLLLLGVVIGGAGMWAARTISGDYLPSGVQTFQSPAGSDFIRVTPGRATIGQAIRCGGDLCIPVVPSR